MKMLIIRADGNARIGAGHLMRCLTIAETARERMHVVFVCADEASASLVQERGYEAYVLYSDYRAMESELMTWETLPVDWQKDKEKNCLLVDSYYVNNDYLGALQKYGTVLLLDDMAHTARNADVVINYNAFANDEMYEALNSPYGTKVYTGGQFIPIRKEFCGRNYVVRDDVKNILITTGGGDSENIAGRILERIRYKECHYHVVTGRFNPHYDKLAALEKENANVHIHHDVKDMAGLMESCDLAVTAGGTTIYELSAIGVPFVCFSYADNQEQLTEYIGRQRIAGYGGAFHKESEQTLTRIRDLVWKLQEDAVLRKSYSRTERRLVDGKGAERIADIIYKI